MKRYNILLLSVLSLFLLYSCEWGLDELKTNEDCEIIDFNFEIREIIKEERVVKDADGNEIFYTVDRVVFKPDQKVSILIDNSNNRVDVTIKAEADIKNIVGYAVISPGAVIAPGEGAPVLGTLGDFSSPLKYKVTAANGADFKIWEINVVQIQES